MQEISRRTWWLLTAVVMAMVVLTATVNAGALGFWEPFESVTLRVGIDDVEAEVAEQVEEEEAAEVDEDESAPIKSAAVPTLDGKPVHISWLKSAWASVAVDPEPVVDGGGIGEVERKVRLPLLVLAILLLGAAALWVRRHLGEGAAAMTVVILATAPIFYLGAIFISAPLVYVAASALAVMAFFESVYGDQKWRYLWAVLGGVALAVVALDERIIGVFATVAVVVGLAAAQAAMAGDKSQGLDPKWGLGGIVAFGALLWWGLYKSSGIEEGFFQPDVAQLLWIAGPIILFASLVMAARHTPVGRALLGLRGAIFVAGAAIPLVLLGMSYSAALPVDPELVEEGSPALAYLLENQVFAGEIAAQGNFAWWWRQIGFGLFPHLIFLVPALGYLSWKIRPDVKSSEIERAMATLCLVWPVAAFAVVVPATSLGHTAFPAFFPLILATGWMLASEEFWRALRLRPAAYLVVAVLAIFTIMIIAKDLENFPTRLIEFVVGGAEPSAIGEDFEYGRALSLWKYAVVAGIGAYFAGMISWLVFGWRDLKRLWRWSVGWIKRVYRWVRRKDAPETASRETDRGGEDELRPGQKRMAEREAWRDEPGWLPRIARRLERLPGLVGLVLFAGLGFMAAQIVSFVDDLDEVLSSRAVIEAYLDSTDDENLWRYQIDEEDSHFYVRGLDEISNRREFNERYDSEERLYALIKTDDLAAIHSRVRRDHEENIPVLAAGGDMYLVSNFLADDEVDINPITDFVLDEIDDDHIPLLVEADDEMVHPEFDRKIEFVGYKFDRGTAEERPEYAWGDTMEITMYFEVKRRIPRSQEIFMHIDLSGNRIHGDHDPVGGIYPTNYWLVGDIIKDVYEIEIDRFTTPGPYTIWAGFYRGDDRMAVLPDEAHDEQNRVNVGTIEVVPF